jgi:hypothetical protein
MAAQSGPPSRRAFLQRAVGAAGATAILCREPLRASAAIKISKGAVAYQDQPEGDKKCAQCAQFEPPAACKLVDGPISPQGYCRLFAPIRQTAI